MKTLRWYGRRDLRYEDAPEPSPAPGQLKIKVSLAGICGTDMTEYAKGPVMIPPDKIPLTMGHEFVGYVVELGEGVTGFDIGDRVSGVGYRYCGECYCCKRGYYNICVNPGFTGLLSDGCFAEYFVMPAYSVYLLPEGVSRPGLFGQKCQASKAMTASTAMAKGSLYLFFRGAKTAHLRLRLVFPTG